MVCGLVLPICPVLAAEGERRSDATLEEGSESAPETRDETRQEAVANDDTKRTRPEQRPNSVVRQQATPKLPPSSRRGSPPPPEFRGPDVTLIAGEERTIYEYRHNGQLRMIKVVPKFGKPYYLAPRDPTRGFGDLEQADTLIAEWVLWEF